MAENKTVTAYLVYRASDATLRTLARRPRLAWDEIAWTIQLTVPDPWGRLAGSVLIELPENGPAVVEVVQEPDRDGSDG